MPKKKRSRVLTAAPQVAVSPAKSDFAPLDKSSFTPMYFQIQSQLLTMVQSGRLRPGDLLPSEEELSRIYGVSRMTSRQALQALKSLGLVSRQKGHGSFVSHPRVEKDIAHLVGFTAEMRALGMKASSRVLASETTSAKPEVAAKLAISVNASIYQLRRLRLSDGLPVAIEEICLPSGRFPGVDQLDFSRLSLYETLRDRYGIRLSRADEIIEARSATNREAQLLEIHPRASLLVISRTLWSTDGVPVETAHSVYRGDRYRAVLRIPATELE
jgi:GntR family transcriptional regulator